MFRFWRFIECASAVAMYVATLVAAVLAAIPAVIAIAGYVLNDQAGQRVAKLEERGL
jgi:hypothetical protein